MPQDACFDYPEWRKLGIDAAFAKAHYAGEMAFGGNSAFQ
jgi:hypothetical protein